MQHLRRPSSRAPHQPRLVLANFPADLQQAKVSALDELTIQLWRGTPPSSADGPREEFAALLSPEEIARMLRFRFLSDQSAFAFARAMLRTLLGGYLDVPPDRLSFHNSELGKPALRSPWSESHVHFNLSHTQGAVLVGVCLGRQIGADIELIREDFEVEDIATRFFSAQEQNALSEFAPGRARRQAFFRCWTRKEAWLKARGSGLSFPLRDFDVSIAAAESEVLLVTRPDAEEARRWLILDGRAPVGYAAAVAISQSPSYSG